jgi:hypothetical protein
MGRNGYYKCSGLELHKVTGVREEGAYISIQPLNSKGAVANCEIHIPTESIDDLIKILKNLK